ncbi:uncharacterized protein LOC126708304 [Quercus robur]|uniref:uncharacterized protein LOC126708304 n=1 Tax=Quercus robur TaxID=38942 RepID=UPI002163256B|nr:uncharacterized protein LOC126708304 [Quercus robur]
MVVKSKLESEHINNLGNIFEILRRHKLKLNASKCSFGVGLGKFLGYMVTRHGIKVNPDQIRAINNLQPPWNLKKVQKLTGMIVALSRFVSQSADRLSLVLVQVDSGVQRPIYYVSKSLHEAKVHYLPLEKVILAVVHVTHKLSHYFQSHTVVVLTQLLLRSLFRSVDYIGRIAKWGTILGAFNIKYMPFTFVKEQVLANLEPLSWRVYVDGVANQRGFEIGLVLISPENITIKKSLRLDFSATNNEGEYEALLVGMAMVQKMGGKVVEIFSDSRLVVGQMGGELEARDVRMQEYFNQVKHLQSGFESFSLLHILRGGNTHADSLATLAISLAQDLPRVILVEDLCKPIEVKREMVHIHQIRVGPSWMDPIVLFLKEDILSEEKSKANKAVGNKRWLLVGMDYFTKWVEAEPLANIRDMDAKRFIWKNIVTRFGIPCTLISDNGFQFDSKAFRRYCCDLGITNRYSTPAYPQENGQVEAVNKVIVGGLKKRLDDAKGKWVEELPHVLWTFRATPRRPTRETPFSMTYGAKAVIPLETGFPTLRTSSFILSSNDVLLEKSLDLIEEQKENAMVQLEYYQHKLK